jgi:hypothetical protein
MYFQVRCCDGSSVWIGQLLYVEPKLSGKLTCTNASSIKLPAIQVLRGKVPAMRFIPELLNECKAPLQWGDKPKTWQQVYTWQVRNCIMDMQGYLSQICDCMHAQENYALPINLPCIPQDGPTAYVNFDFYNGAMSTGQCQELRQVLETLNQDSDVKAIVLLGSKSFFSNGVHLNVIEAADDPAYESWLNINAIDDVVKATFESSNKLVVSALQSNAGAGGAMWPLASDLVWAQKDVVFNFHYELMGLYGR